MPNWTKEQNDAIYTTGKNIIVSAGAGSGKTAVLTERVLKKLEEGVSIDHLLILTFTKAAANEMKMRIRKKIKNNENLKNQLNKLDSSYITTFDSFTLSIVRKYHYLLGIKKDVDIIEDNILKIKTLEFLDLVMEDEYKKKDIDFTKLINDFCIKDDADLRKQIISLNNKLNMKYDKEDYLNNYLENSYNEEIINKRISEYTSILKEIIESINNNLDKISNEVEIDYFNKLMEIFIPLLNSNNYDDIRKNTISINRLPNLPKNSSDEGKNIKENISNSLKELKELVRFNSTLEIISTYEMTKPYIKSIVKIIKKLDLLVNNYKYENDLYDFVDVSKMAINLVKENENIKNEIRDYFHEIMIDEYQDTSDLQEELIKEISNNNLYMVGDIKQSIYRFRNANPDIFRNKYNLYSKDSVGIKIDLLKNFRSRMEVIDNINLIFNSIMSDEMGGANYKTSHQMIFGNTNYSIEGKTNQNNNFEIYQYDYDKGNGFTKDEIEAFIICDDIKSKVENRYQIFDKDKKILRNVTYNDFSILIDRSSSFELYKKIFLYKKIPLSLYKDEYLTDSSLFFVIRNIFKLILLSYEEKYNKEMEYAFLSVGRSFLFDYQDDELFNIIQNNNYKDTVIFNKINSIVNNLSNKSISIILDEIITSFDVYNKLRRIPDIVNNYIKIDYLYTLATNLNKMGYNIRDFDLYLESIINNDKDIRFSLNKEDTESVKLMTIHKSKGLEYHICYFPSLTKKFNESDIKDKIIYDNDLGIITPYYSLGMDDTFYKDLVKKHYYNEEISEKIRLFYVALTRVKEKMIFILPNSEIKEDEISFDNTKIKYRSFSDILKSINSKLNSYIKNIDISKINISKDYNLVNAKNLFNNLKKVNNTIKIMDYPKIEKSIKEENHYSKSDISLINSNKKEIMGFGTKMHYYLETLDLKNPSFDNIEEEYKEKIESFLNSPLLKNVNDAKIYQEYEFINECEKNIMHGIIDLMIEYDDYIDIIDYKLKNIDDISYIKQLNGYKDYVFKIKAKPINLYLYSLIDGVYKKI